MTESIIKILQSGDEAILEEFLLPRVESSMFLIGNMRTSGLLDNGRPYTGTYAAAFEGDRVIGVVAHYWNQNLVFQSPVQLEALCRAAVDASRRPIGGLIGPNAQVMAAKRALAVEEANFRLDSAEKLYSLRLDELAMPADLSSGQVRGRRIEPRDLELIIRWRVAYSVETLGEKDTPQLWEECRSEIERSLQERRTWVLEAQGEPVACSSFNATLAEAVQVGGVWTPPEFRRRGYGRSVVAASLLDARLEGAEKAILFTREDNLAAQKAYTTLNFYCIGDYRLTLLQSPLGTYAFTSTKNCR